MIYPDYIPWYIALPVFITLLIIWRRQVVVANRKKK